MKILYSAGNYFGANIFLSEFLKKTNGHDVKIMAYYKNHSYLHHIDWTTDALVLKHNIFQWQINHIFETNESLPKLNPETTIILYNDIAEWMPNLVISDVEPISALLAHSLDIELWYCSPLLLTTGIEQKFSFPKDLVNLTARINRLPKANRYLINSPFCDIVDCPFLLDDFEWVKPYIVEPEFKYKQSRDIDILSGETSFVASSIYSNKNPCIFFNDDEQMLNAFLAEKYNIGLNLGNNSKTFNTLIERTNFITNFLNIQSWPTLDELINKN